MFSLFHASSTFFSKFPVHNWQMNFTSSPSIISPASSPNPIKLCSIKPLLVCVLCARAAVPFPLPFLFPSLRPTPTTPFLAQCSQVSQSAPAHGRDQFAGFCSPLPYILLIPFTLPMSSVSFYVLVFFFDL